MAQMNEASRRELIRKRVEAATKEGGYRTVQLPWRDSQKSFPVVRLPLDAVLLNPDSHRIKSQLMSHPDRRTVYQDPWSDEAQVIIARILKETGQYEDLKSNLDEVGQQEPGVVTRAGVLVNANRRATGLRDLGTGYIDVAVLDPGTTSQELAELELALQMKKEFREEYSFTNRLLFIKELTDLGWSAEKIALRLNLAASRDDKELKKGREEVLRDLRMLGMIRQVQEIAEDADAEPVPLTFFDGKRQILLEIDKAYEKRQEKDPGKADFVKRMRLVGLLTDAGYKELREMDEDFLDEYLLDALGHTSEEDGFPGDLRPLLAQDDDEQDEEGLGLGILGGASTEDDGGLPTADPEELLSLLAGTHEEELVEVPGRDGEGTVSVTREDLVDHLTTAIMTAAEEHKSDSKFTDRLMAPIKKVEAARRQLDLIGKKLDRVHNRAGFDWHRFEKRMNGLRRSYEALLTKVSKLRPTDTAEPPATTSGTDG